MFKVLSRLLVLSALFFPLTSHAQKRENYEYYKNFPKYADQLIADPEVRKAYLGEDFHM